MHRKNFSSTEITTISETVPYISWKEASDTPQPTNDKQSYNVTVMKKELSNLLFLSVELHNTEFIVHIREFRHYLNKTDVYPTNQGIAMDIFTWYDFSKKIMDFSSIYPACSFVANNNIIVLNHDAEIYIRNIDDSNPTKLKLKESQLIILKQLIPEVNEAIIQFMYLEYLPTLIIQERRVVTNSSKSETSMLAQLITWIELDFLVVFKNIFQCEGCKICHFNILNHTCITLTNREKYQQLGDDVLMLTNIHAIVQNFLMVIDFVTYDFLLELNVDIIRNVIFNVLQ